LGDTGGKRESGGGREATRKGERDLLKKPRVETPGVAEGEGIRKKIRHSTDDGEREARTRYNVDLAGKSRKQ